MFKCSLFIHNIVLFAAATPLVCLSVLFLLAKTENFRWRVNSVFFN